MTQGQFDKLCRLLFWLLSAVYARIAMVAERIQGDETWAVIYGLSALILMICAGLTLFKEAK